MCVRAFFSECLSIRPEVAADSHSLDAPRSEYEIYSYKKCFCVFVRA